MNDGFPLIYYIIYNVWFAMLHRFFARNFSASQFSPWGCFLGIPSWKQGYGKYRRQFTLSSVSTRNYEHCYSKSYFDPFLGKPVYNKNWCIFAPTPFPLLLLFPLSHWCSSYIQQRQASIKIMLSNKMQADTMTILRPFASC